MDPNEALKEFRSAYSDWEDTRGRGENLKVAVNAADRMREAMVVLDEWLSNGGFPPSDWNTARNHVENAHGAKIIQAGNITGNIGL